MQSYLTHYTRNFKLRGLPEWRNKHGRSQQEFVARTFAHSGALFCSEKRRQKGSQYLVVMQDHCELLLCLVDALPETLSWS